MKFLILAAAFLLSGCMTAFVPYQSLHDVLPISIRDKTRSGYYVNN